jgi:hypothetical protein
MMSKFEKECWMKTLNFTLRVIAVISVMYAIPSILGYKMNIDAVTNAFILIPPSAGLSYFVVLYNGCGKKDEDKG